VAFQQTSGPALQIKGDLTAILTNVRERQVLFFDEVHRLQPALEEILYSALEDYKLDIIIGRAPQRGRTPLMCILSHLGGHPRAIDYCSAAFAASGGCCLGAAGGLDTHDELRFIVERSARDSARGDDREGAQ